MVCTNITALSWCGGSGHKARLPTIEIEAIVATH